MDFVCMDMSGYSWKECQWGVAVNCAFVDARDAGDAREAEDSVKSIGHCPLGDSGWVDIG